MENTELEKIKSNKSEILQEIQDIKSTINSPIMSPKSIKLNFDFDNDVNTDDVENKVDENGIKDEDEVEEIGNENKNDNDNEFIDNDKIVKLVAIKNNLNLDLENSKHLTNDDLKVDTDGSILVRIDE